MHTEIKLTEIEILQLKNENLKLENSRMFVIINKQMLDASGQAYEKQEAAFNKFFSCIEEKYKVRLGKTHAIADGNTIVLIPQNVETLAQSVSGPEASSPEIEPILEAQSRDDVNKTDKDDKKSKQATKKRTSRKRRNK